MRETLARYLTVPVTLMVTVVLVSVLAWIFKPVKRGLILNPYQVRHGFQVHRLLTAGWLHSDGMHLAFNMISLYMFSDPVLKALGVTRYLVLYVSAVVVAFIPSTIRQMNKRDYNTLGASGAVVAVMFSAILLDPTLKLYFMFIPVPIPAAIYGLIYLVYCVWSAHRRRGDGINHEAHFAGAIYGAGLTFLFESAHVIRSFKALFHS